MFHVGDEVEFKTWEEMKDEYGINEEACGIDCLFYFTYSMEDSIDRSKTYTISKIYDDGMVDFTEEPCNYGYYTYSTDMIKPIENDSEENNENVISIDKWKINTSIPNFDYDIEVGDGYKARSFVDIIKSILLDKTTLFVSIDSIIGEALSVIKYYKRTLPNKNIIVAIVGIGEENYKATDGIKADNADIKLLQEENITLLITPSLSVEFNNKEFINGTVNLLSKAFPTEDKELLAIREYILNNDENGVEIRDNYIERNVEAKKKKALYETCDKLGDAIIGQKSRVLEDEVNRISAKLEEAKMQYYDYMANLNEAKKNLSYFKYMDTDKNKDDLENIIRADIESGELISFQISGDTLYFKIVEPLLYFDEDDWEKVKYGVLRGSGEEKYEPVLDAIFTRKCTLTIEQGASMCINARRRDVLNNYSWQEGRSFGIPNSHMERYNCWDANRSDAYEYISEGNYDLAYIQMKSAIAGINVCDSPVIYEFCKYMRTYSHIRCITDNETGQFFTIDEANNYYKELKEGDVA